MLSAENRLPILMILRDKIGATHTRMDHQPPNHTCFPNGYNSNISVNVVIIFLILLLKCNFITGAVRKT